MDSLIFISPFVNKFLAFFQYIFVSERKATQYNLLLLVLGIAVTSCLSVRKCFRHVASRLSDKSLNSFYYLMSSGKISLNIWSTQRLQRKIGMRRILLAGAHPHWKALLRGVPSTYFQTRHTTQRCLYAANMQHDIVLGDAYGKGLAKRLHI